MGLGTVARLVLVAVFALAVTYEFVAGFGVEVCPAHRVEDGFRGCTVEAECADGPHRGHFSLSRHERCPDEAWYAPLWGGIRKPGLTSGYAYTLFTGIALLVAFGPAGLLNPREKRRVPGF